MDVLAPDDDEGLLCPKGDILMSDFRNDILRLAATACDTCWDWLLLSIDVV